MPFSFKVSITSVLISIASSFGSSTVNSVSISKVGTLISSISSGSSSTIVLASCKTSEMDLPTLALPFTLSSYWNKASSGNIKILAVSLCSASLKPKSCSKLVIESLVILIWPVKANSKYSFNLSWFAKAASLRIPSSSIAVIAPFISSSTLTSSSSAFLVSFSTVSIVLGRFFSTFSSNPFGSKSTFNLLKTVS